MKKNARDRILETASYLFHKQGYNSTGINQIIHEADIAKATLYQYYSSKENLAIDYLETRHMRWMALLNEFVEKGTTSKEKLLLAFDFIMYMNEKEDYKGCCFLKMLSEIQPEEIEIRNVILKHKNDLRETLALMANDNSTNIQKQIYILFEGALIVTHLQRDQWAAMAAKETISDIII